MNVKITELLTFGFLGNAVLAFILILASYPFYRLKKYRIQDRLQYIANGFLYLALFFMLIFAVS